jgi:hypothetical protein
MESNKARFKRLIKETENNLNNLSGLCDYDSPMVPGHERAEGMYRLIWVALKAIEEVDILSIGTDGKTAGVSDG